MNQLIFKGVTYEVIEKEPITKGFINNPSVKFNIYLAKPKGRVLYHSYEFSSGFISDPVSLGNMGITREAIKNV